MSIIKLYPPIFRALQILFVVLLSLVHQREGFAQSARQLNREGVKLYEESKYQEAEEKYKEALQINSNLTESSYNLGLIYYRQENYTQAIKQFKSALTRTQDETLQAKLNHNLGNSYLQLNQLKESIEAYQNSLRLNPQDEDSRYNLTIAQLKLKAQQKQQPETKDLLNKVEQEEKNSQQFMRRNKNLGKEVKNW